MKKNTMKLNELSLLQTTKHFFSFELNPSESKNKVQLPERLVRWPKPANVRTRREKEKVKQRQAKRHAVVGRNPDNESSDNVEEQCAAMDC
jgi:hypothetical protein